MSAKKLKGQIAGEVPQDLIDAFDACVDRLGVTKKRGIAAAVHAFVSAGAEAQHDWLRAVYEHHYAPSDGGRAVSVSEAELARRAGAAVARGGSKRRRTSGKNSA
jgi:hypothetical protein